MIFKILLGLLVLTVGFSTIPAFAEIDTPYKQFTNGTPMNQIDCGDMILLESPRNTPACVSEASSIILEQRGYDRIVKDIIHITEPTILYNTVNPHKIDYGTTTATSSSDTISAISNFCAGWPKNFAVEFPNVVTVGEEFNINVNYTNIIFEEEDILESKLSGVPLTPDDHADQLEGPRGNCFDTFVYFILNNKTSLVTPHIVIQTEEHDNTKQIKTFSRIEYPFNNTVPQTQTITMQINSLPDRYDSSILLGTQSDKISIKHFVDDNGILYLHTTPSDNTLVSVSKEASAYASMSYDQISQSNFYTKELTLPEPTTCEIFACDENGIPAVGNSGSLPPMDSLAEFLKTSVPLEDLVAWLESEEILTPEYIEELLDTYFPDLVSRFILSLDFDIFPVAHAAPLDQLYLYGTAAYGTVSFESNPHVVFNGVKICVFDRNESTGEDVLLYNGQTPVCDITDRSGNFALTPFKDDPNDSDSIDIIFYIYPSNNYFNFVKSKTLDPNTEELITHEVDFSHLPIDNKLVDFSFILSDVDADNIEIIKAIKILHIMEDSKNFIKDTYNYDPCQVTVDITFDDCGVVQYEPYDYAPEKVIFLDDQKRYPLCNALVKCSNLIPPNTNTIIFILI